MRNRQSIRLLIFLLVGTFACGCGGGTPDPANAPNQQSTPIVTRPPVVASPASQGTKRLAKKRNASSSKPPKSTDEASTDIDDSVDSADIFEFAENEPNFEVLGPAPKVKPSDRFAVVTPKLGEDSSTFQVTELGRDPNAPPDGKPNPRLKLPAGFKVAPRTGYSSNGLPRRIVRGQDTSEMVLVPEGKFLQGQNGGPSNAGPRHSIVLDPYYIDIAEVTVGQYEAYRAMLKKSGERVPRASLNSSAPKNHPVLGVSWPDARDYTRWVGKDLPTEAEWEKAARGESGFDSPWGNGRAVWTRTRHLRQIDPAKSFHTDFSPYGVYDMAGNAREWCSDWYSDRAYQEAGRLNQTRLRNWEGPREPSVKHYRVVKGNGPNWTVWHRSGADMRRRFADIGFRGVIRVPVAGRSR